MRLFFFAAALAAIGLAAAAPPPPCAKDAAICTVPLITDDTEPAALVAEPPPARIAPIAPPPVSIAPVTPPPAPAPVAIVPAVPMVVPPPPAPAPIAVGIVDVLDWQLRDYWLPRGDEPPVQPQRARGRCERATLTARFIVNSKGYTDEVRVLRNTALNPIYEQRVENRIRDRTYTPAPINPQRQSVRVEETFRFSC